jgi:type II secretory pathway component HofQ
MSTVRIVKLNDSEGRRDRARKRNAALDRQAAALERQAAAFERFAAAAEKAAAAWEQRQASVIARNQAALEHEIEKAGDIRRGAPE